MKLHLSALSLLPLMTSSALALDYEADILPIFASKCAKCHLDGNSKGGLALDLEEISREIGSSKVIVAGDPEKSDLLELVSLPDDDGDKMPPEGKGRPMSDSEIATLREWIEGGAVVGDGEPTMTEAETPDAEKPQRPEPVAGSWTNTSGKTIEATLIRVDGSNAILRMGTKDYPYPIAHLDGTAQATIKAFADQWAKAEAP
ncbi:MAG: hypothetical protein P1U68_06815 [Verrucomicrobiales bacterium]|nr:hypothetical protein [Verrucomicrobiales bacterium]